MMVIVTMVSAFAFDIDIGAQLLLAHIDLHKPVHVE